MVAINHFPTDTAEEIAVVQQHCARSGSRRCVRRRSPRAARAARELAEVVWDARRSAVEPHFRRSTTGATPIEQKIATVAREMYGAEAVDYTARAKRDREQLEKLGFGKLPVCIAKTQQSLSDNPALLGRPKDFLVTVREIQLAAGAGFIVPITGEILRMPGLPKEPMSSRFDLSDDGEVLFSRP